MEAFKKFCPRGESPPEPWLPAIEIWFQDKMRVGQKNKLTYRWARKGSRPRADCSAQYAPSVEPVLPSCCPPVTAKPCSFILRQSPKRSQPEPMRFCSSIRLGGMALRPITICSRCSVHPDGCHELLLCDRDNEDAKRRTGLTSEDQAIPRYRRPLRRSRTEFLRRGISRRRSRVAQLTTHPT